MPLLTSTLCQTTIAVPTSAGVQRGKVRGFKQLKQIYSGKEAATLGAMRRGDGLLTFLRGYEKLGGGAFVLLASPPHASSVALHASSHRPTPSTLAEGISFSLGTRSFPAPHPATLDLS